MPADLYTKWYLCDALLCMQRNLSVTYRYLPKMQILTIFFSSTKTLKNTEGLNYDNEFPFSGPFRKISNWLSSQERKLSGGATSWNSQHFKVKRNGQNSMRHLLFRSHLPWQTKNVNLSRNMKTSETILRRSVNFIIWYINRIHLYIIYISYLKCVCCSWKWGTRYKHEQLQKDGIWLCSRILTVSGDCGTEYKTQHNRR